MMGRFVALTGIDGAGKTTLSSILCSLLRRSGRKDWSLVTRHSVVPSGHPMTKMVTTVGAAIWEDYGAAASSAGDLFWFHQRMAWYALVSPILAERLANAESIIVDDWYYKIYARFLAKNRRIEYLDATVAAFLQPDTVVLVDIEPEAAAERKASIKPGEAGLFDGFTTIDRSSFVAYQTLVSTQLRRLAAEKGWHRVSGLDSPDRSAATIAALL